MLIVIPPPFPALTTKRLQLKLTFYPRQAPSLMDLNPHPPPEPPDPPDPPDRATPSQSKTFIFFLLDSSAALLFVTQLEIDVVAPPPRVSGRARSAQLEGRLTGSVHHFPATTLTSAPPSRLTVVTPPSRLAAVTPTSHLAAALPSPLAAAPPSHLAAAPPSHLNIAPRRFQSNGLLANNPEGGLIGSGRSHLLDYMYCQPDLIPVTPPPPGRVTSGRETSSPLRSCASPMQSPQEALPSGNPDSSFFI